MNDSDVRVYPPGVRAAYMGDLTAALVSEAELLSGIREVLQRQRVAVAENDVQALEDSIGALARAVLVAGELRELRSSLLRRLTGESEIRLDDPRLGGEEVSPALQDARSVLRRAAIRVAQELAVNRHIVSRAMRSGEEMIQRLFAGGASAESAYAELEGNDVSSRGGMLVNRSV